MRTASVIWACTAAIIVMSPASDRRADAATPDTVSAEDFGSCEWDGVHDVGPCIQASLDAARDQHGIVTIPAGAWPVGAAINLPTGSTLRAVPSSRGSATLKPTSDNVSKPLLLNVFRHAHIRVENLALDGGGADFDNANPVVSVTQADDVVFDRVDIRNSRGVGLLFQGGVTRSGVVDGKFVNLGNHWKTTLSRKDRLQGVVFCCGSGNSENFAKHDIFADIGLDALQFSDQSEFTAIGNTFNLENNEHGLIQAPDFPAAIFPMYSVHSLIADNSIDGAQGCGIDAPGLRDSKITGNSIRDSHACGIGLFQGYDKVTQIENVEISHNVVVDNVRWRESPFKGGITIASGSPHGIAIADNTIGGAAGARTQVFGVQVLKNTHLSGLVIEGDNTFAGNARAAIDREDE